MNHLILCREYPPAPGGGIGAYAANISRLLAESGETVHVIGQAWEGAPAALQETHRGRLVVHRLAVEDWHAPIRPRPHPALGHGLEAALFRSGYFPQAFAWMAARLAERLVEEEGIDLIEGQEYEAPLYYFMLRRAVGLGPKRQPPCLVHLHSPTEFIAQHNEWSPGSFWVRTARRMEEYCLGSADALLCPSRRFAREAEGRYALEAGSIEVIPLPLGGGSDLERSPEVWSKGSISYVGRLERRKGVLEWMRAARGLAQAEPDLVFEFAGANVLGDDRVTSEVLLREIIPGNLRDRFVFLGECDRNSLRELRQRSRIAAVPSRWENFPYTCMEACASGLPVIATRRGGLEEMIEHGLNGWLAPDATAAGLELALRQALETPADTLAEMGRRGSERIRSLCDDQDVLARHIELRRRVANRQRRSLRPEPASPREGSAMSSAGQAERRGVAVLIAASQNSRAMLKSLESLDAQAATPVHIAMLHGPGLQPGAGERRWLEEAPQRRSLVAAPSRPMHQVRSAALMSLNDAGFRPAGVCFLAEGDQLEPEALSVCEGALRRCPEVGIVSFWRRSAAGDFIGLTPSGFVHDADEVQAASSSVYRMEAIEEYLRREVGPNGLDGTRLPQGLLGQGWSLIVVPTILALEKTSRSAGRGHVRRRPPERSWHLAPLLRAVVRHPFVSAKAAMPLLRQWMHGARRRPVSL